MVDNPDPVVKDVPQVCANNEDGFDSSDVFDIIGCIRDPEHPFSLAQLDVISQENIEITVETRESSSKPPQRKPEGSIHVMLKPTVPHCSYITLIALCVHSRLQRYLPVDVNWKIRLTILKGAHKNDEALTKQFNDKERVCAALENPDVLKDVERCIDDDMCIYS